MSRKYTCPKTGIRFEGELVAKELGIVPEPVETVLGPIRIEVKPSDLPRRDEVTTELGVTFRGRSCRGG